MISIPAPRRRNTGLAILTAAALFAAGCSSPDAPTNATGAEAMVRGPVNAGTPRTFRDEYRELARRVPAFAGVFLDSLGRLTINFAPGSSDPSAVGEVVRWVHRVRPALRSVGNPKIRHVPFAYSTLDSYYEPLVGVIGSMSFVTS